MQSAATAKSLHSCPTLCDPKDGSPPGSGILQARTLEWVAIFFSIKSIRPVLYEERASQVALVVKNLLANAGDIRSLGWEDPLKEGTTTHSSILAWRIPRTEEPGRLQCTGSQIIRHD